MPTPEIQRILDWQAGEPAGPWSIDIFPTFRCNLQCGICIQHSLEDPQHFSDELPDARWEEIVREGAALGVQWWTIGGGGEPMVRGDLVLRLCQQIRAAGMHGWLQTNGTFFNEDKLQALIDCAWEGVTFSIDASSQALNDEIRSAGAFVKATEALRLLKKLKEKAGSALPEVHIGAVITALNAGDLVNMVRLATELGAQRLFFHKYQHAPASLEKYALSPEAVQAIRPHFEAAAALADNLGLELAGDLCTALGAAPDSTPGQPVTCRSPWGQAYCYYAWRNIALFSNGLVNPCCHLWLDDPPNIRDRSLEEVWQGAFYNQIREDFLNNDPPPQCRKHCPPAARAKNSASRMEMALENWRTEEAARYPLTPLGLARKVRDAIKKQGFLTSCRRAGEWLKNRRV